MNRVSDFHRAWALIFCLLLDGCWPVIAQTHEIELLPAKGWEILCNPHHTQCEASTRASNVTIAVRPESGLVCDPLAPDCANSPAHTNLTISLTPRDGLAFRPFEVTLALETPDEVSHVALLRPERVHPGQEVAVGQFGTIERFYFTFGNVRRTERATLVIDGLYENGQAVEIDPISFRQNWSSSPEFYPVWTAFGAGEK